MHCETGETVMALLCGHLKLINLRALQVARFLGFVDQRFSSMVFRVVGYGAEDVLVHLVGDVCLSSKSKHFVPMLAAS